MSSKPKIDSLGLGQVVPTLRTPDDMDRPKSERPPSRRGKSTLVSHHDPAVIHLLKQMALDENRTQQSLVAEALNMLFVSRGKKTIADEGRNR